MLEKAACGNALRLLDKLLKKGDFSNDQHHKRGHALLIFYTFLEAGESTKNASKIASKGMQRSPGWGAWRVRAWAREWEETERVPEPRVTLG